MVYTYGNRHTSILGTNLKALGLSEDPGSSPGWIAFSDKKSLATKSLPIVFVESVRLQHNHGEFVQQSLADTDNPAQG